MDEPPRKEEFAHDTTFRILSEEKLHGQISFGVSSALPATSRSLPQIPDYQSASEMPERLPPATGDFIIPCIGGDPAPSSSGTLDTYSGGCRKSCSDSTGVKWSGAQTEPTRNSVAGMSGLENTGEQVYHKVR